MSASTRVKAAIGAVLFAGFAVLSVGCNTKAPAVPVPAPGPVTEQPQLYR